MRYGLIMFVHGNEMQTLPPGSTMLNSYFVVLIQFLCNGGFVLVRIGCQVQSLRTRNKNRPIGLLSLSTLGGGGSIQNIVTSNEN